jgi:hypothetical protein
VKAASILLNISILDHLIITQESYFSFVDEGIFMRDGLKIGLLVFMAKSWHIRF